MVHITPCPPPPPATLPLDPPKQVCLQHWHGSLTPIVAHPEGVKVIQSDPPSHIILPLEPPKKGHLLRWHGSPAPHVAGPGGVNSMDKIGAPLDESFICPRSPHHLILKPAIHSPFPPLPLHQVIPLHPTHLLMGERCLGRGS